jgi:hypothetical protein
MAIIFKGQAVQEDEGITFLEMSGMSNPVTQNYIPGDLNLQLD